MWKTRTLFSNKPQTMLNLFCFSFSFVSAGTAICFTLSLDSLIADYHRTVGRPSQRLASKHNGAFSELFSVEFSTGCSEKEPKSEYCTYMYHVACRCSAQGWTLNVNILQWISVTDWTFGSLQTVILANNQVSPAMNKH